MLHAFYYTIALLLTDVDVAVLLACEQQLSVHSINALIIELLQELYIRRFQEISRNFRNYLVFLSILNPCFKQIFIVTITIASH